MQSPRKSSTRGVLSGPRHAAKSQRGVVLFVALIVMVALSLAGIALVRSIETTTSITGNIAFRQSALMQANWAIENAIGDIYADDSKKPANVLTKDEKKIDQSAKCYLATFDVTTDSSKSAQPALPAGIPQTLWKSSTAKGLPPYCRPQDSLTGNTVSYVIQRMCLPAAAGAEANQAQCDLMQPKQALGTTVGDEAINMGKYPLYRVTVRVDGPNNALSFVQAMIRG